MKIWFLFILKIDWLKFKHYRYKHVNTAIGNIKRTDKFEYVGEWIQPKGLYRKESERRQNYQTSYYEINSGLFISCTKNKRAILYEAKIRQYGLSGQIYDVVQNVGYQTRKENGRTRKNKNKILK